MSRVTNIRKKRLQHLSDRAIHKAKRALQRRRHPKPVKKTRIALVDQLLNAA